MKNNKKNIKFNIINSNPKINIFSIPKKTKNKNIFAPKINPKFITSQQFLSPYPSKKTKNVAKKDMNWIQAKQRNPRLHPFKDYDKDGVPNVFDCKPYDKNRQGILKNIASSITKAVAPVTKAVATTYAKVDKAVFAGALPGGAPKTSTTTTTAKTTPATPTTTTTPTSSSSSSSSKLFKDAGLTKETTTTKSPTSSSSSSSSNLFKDAGLTKEVEIDLSKPASIENETKKATSSSKPFFPIKNIFTLPTPTIYPISRPPTYDSKTGIYTDAQGNKTSIKTAPSDAILIGGGWPYYNPEVIKKPEPPRIDSVKPEKYEYEYEYKYEPLPQPQLTQPQKMLSRQELFQGLESLKERIAPQATQANIPQISEAYEISPEQLFESDILKGKFVKYPLILNINPLERGRGRFITKELMRLQPRITYSTQIPTRLSIVAPIGTKQQVAMARSGLVGSKYAEYIITIPKN